VWADIVLRAERQHAVELLSWAALSLVMGTASLVATRTRREPSPLLDGFATQLTAWALVIGLVGSVELHRLTLRDRSAATRLERLTWVRAGFDIGIIGAGALFAGASHVFARSLRGLGAAAAITANGLALLVIDLQLAVVISR
jgi:hypothetical protein